MKKTYINPRVRVAEVECRSLIALSAGGTATDAEVHSRRLRQEEEEEEEEEEEDIIDMLLMQQQKK